MFINEFIRIGHGKFVNGYMAKNGDLYFYVNIGKYVQKKQIKFGDNRVNIVSVGNKLAMTEVMPISNDIQIARYEKSVRLL